MRQRERPIIMQAESVRAILDGRKNQTRRVIKPSLMQCLTPEDEPETFVEWCPYGQPGDRLWVKHGYDLFPVYFKPILGWEGIYSAGTDGQIYRVDGSLPSVLKGTPNSKGYLTVALSFGEWTTKAVHKLICEAFYGPAPFEGAQVRHMDGDRANNLPSNLDWGTQSQNWQDRKAHGRGMKEDHHAARLTAEQVQEIRASTKSQRLLSREYDVSQSTIWQVKKGHTWGSHEAGKRNAPAFTPWKSPLFMPRWASRITLEVTGVRVERLFDITQEDAQAEGVSIESTRTLTYRGAFAITWDVINKKRGYGWEGGSNPWVWVVSFRVVQP